MNIRSFEFHDTRIEDHNPLDYLEDQFALKRKPRSSMESSDRRLEIPICEPPYISRRRDSNRSRLFLEMTPHSPQLSPCRLAFKQGSGSFMQMDNFAQDVDFLFPARERLPSETCLSSNRLSSDCFTSQPLFGEQSSNPLEESLSQQLAQDEDLAMKDTNFVGLDVEPTHLVEDAIKDNPQQHLDILNSLQPISVVASNESSTEESACPTSEPIISREGKRKLKAGHSPATMIQHNVRRKKKTTAQVEYLRNLFDQLGGNWDGKVRKEAMRKTGLSRIQIYKWFFDMKLQQKPKERKVSPEERVSYPPFILQTYNSEELESGAPRPIFLVEKVARK